MQAPSAFSESQIESNTPFLIFNSRISDRERHELILNQQKQHSFSNSQPSSVQLMSENVNSSSKNINLEEKLGSSLVVHSVSDSPSSIRSKQPKNYVCDNCKWCCEYEIGPNYSCKNCQCELVSHIPDSDEVSTSDNTDTNEYNSDSQSSQ
jgi:hypothetical protein